MNCWINDNLKQSLMAWPRALLLAQSYLMMKILRRVEGWLYKCVNYTKQRRPRPKPVLGNASKIDINSSIQVKKFIAKILGENWQQFTRTGLGHENCICPWLQLDKHRQLMWKRTDRTHSFMFSSIFQSFYMWSYYFYNKKLYTTVLKKLTKKEMKKIQRS